MKGGNSNFAKTHERQNRPNTSKTAEDAMSLKVKKKHRQ